MLINCLKRGIKNRNSVLNRVGKSAIFVLNRVRVWGAAPHLPTQGYIEYPPGYRLPSTQTLVRGWLSHMNSQEYPPGFPIVATSTTYMISPAFNSNSGEGVSITYEFPGVPPGFSYCCNLYYLHDIASLQLKLWWGGVYHIWIPRSTPPVFLLLQPLLLTWYRLPSTQTLVGGWLSHMNSQVFAPCQLKRMKIYILKREDDYIETPLIVEKVRLIV